MRHLLNALLILPFLVNGQPPPGYYDATFQLSGEALRQALYEIISGHSVVPNSQIWAAFEITDKKPNGTVWDMYSDLPGGQPPYVYEFVTDQCGNYNSEGDCFNREHSFPQSWYGSAAPMSTDLFHLYPADAWVNQQRGNHPFATVAVPDWTSLNGGKRGPCSWPGCSGTVFEPINEYKGDFARSFFYMLTRYLPLLASWNTPMMQDGNFSGWAGSVLLAWHVQDPVSQKEIDRNNAVYTLQGNRNPYIDQPHWAHYVWGPTASVEEPPMTAAQMWQSDGTLYVRTRNEGMTARLRIFDAAGRLVLEQHSLEPVLDLPLHLPAGLYTSTLTTTGSVQAIRFIR